MTRRPVVAVFAAALAMSASGAEARGGAAPEAAAGLVSFDAVLAEQCRTGAFSGVVRATLADRLVYQRTCGLADRAGGVPLRSTSRFKIFSVSKVFTGTLAMALADRGLLRLNDRASSFVPALPRSWRAVTIAQLLQHTSGIPDLTPDLAHRFLQGPPTSWRGAMAEVLADADRRETKLQTAPGETWVYNNFGYEIVAMVIEAAAKESFAQAMTQYLFKPARLPSAEIARPRFVRGKLSGSVPSRDLAIGYACAKDGGLPVESNQFVQLGAGSIYASAADLEAFDRALVSGRVISSRMQAGNVINAFKVNDDVRYGYGWMIRTAGSERYLQHSGGNNGFVSEFARGDSMPFTVVVLSNDSCSDVSKIRHDLVDALVAIPHAAPVQPVSRAGRAKS